MDGQSRINPKPSFLLRAADILRPGRRGRANPSLSTVPEKGPLPNGWSEKGDRNNDGATDSNGKASNGSNGKENDDDDDDPRRYARTIPRKRPLTINVNPLIYVQSLGSSVCLADRS